MPSSPASITGFALSSSRLTAAIVVLVIFAGLSQFLTFPRQEDPPIVIREAKISAEFPGMTPERMEELITRRIEERIRTMPEIKDIKSVTKTGSTLITVSLRDEYEDLATIWQRLRNKMADMAGSLPEGTQGPFVNDEFGLTAVATIALWADGFTMPEMRLVARDIRDRLYALEGIRKVELHGVQEERIYLKFSNAKLSSFGVSASYIVETLTAQNIILPGGHINTASREIVLATSGNFESLEDIAGALIDMPNSEELVRLDDLVTVSRATEDPPSPLAFYNGQPAVVISVSIVPGVNSVDFGERLRHKVRALENELPIGYVLDFATFQPDLVVAAVDGALNNVYQTLVIVLGVVMLFLGLKAGLIVGAFVPITMLLGLLIMAPFGIELERVSIISAIVALGMLVDNAIVVAEEIRSRLERGEDRRAACEAAGRALALPLLTSSLTTILAFVPMLLLKGSTGEYIFSLPMVVIILLLGSWFLSLTMTPVMCFWFMTVKAQSVAKEAYDSQVYQIYRRLLEKALRARYLVLLVVALLLGLSVYGSTFLVKIFFGPSDRNQFLVNVDLPAGFRITETERMTRQITAWLANREINPEVESSIAYVGNGGPRFFLSLSPVDAGSNVAFLVVNTKTSDDVIAAAARLRGYLFENFPDVNARVKRMWLGANEPGLVKYRLVGPDKEHLYAKSKELTAALWDLPGIDYVYNDWQNKVPRVEVLVDQVRARRAGVTSQSVALSLKAFLDGQDFTEFREGDLAIPVVIQADDQEREVLGDLWNTSVQRSDGNPVPLPQIATFRGVWQFSAIARENQERAVTLSTRHQQLSAAKLNQVKEEALAKIELKPGHRLELGGELEDSAEANQKLFGNLPYCGLLVMLLLVWQFNSFRRPVIIALTIPLAFCGALAGLLLLRAPFDFFSMLGLLSLAGVIINNGIVLIDRFDDELAKGQAPYEAIVASALARFRPIMMSAMTTILGVLPLILFQDPLFYSMACIIAFGLALGTVLTLVVVPILFSFFFTVKIPAAPK